MKNCISEAAPKNPGGILLASLTAAALLPGCASPGGRRTAEGAGTGATIGAGIGLLVGLLSGKADVAAKAVAVGAAAGAVQGGYEGWRQHQDDERTRQITQAIRESSAGQAALDNEARQRENLTRFLGVWQMSGWFQMPGKDKVTVSAQVNGNMQMRYFVKLAYIDLKADGLTGQVWGTSTLGYDQDSGVELTTRFSTLPDALELSGGTFDSDLRAFTFADAEGTTVIRFETPDRFTVTTIVDGATVESYGFSRS